MRSAYLLVSNYLWRNWGVLRLLYAGIQLRDRLVLFASLHGRRPLRL